MYMVSLLNVDTFNKQGVFMSLRFIAMTLFLGMLALTAAGASSGDQASSFTSSYDGSIQPYRMYIPEGKSAPNPLPLAVVLHGKGVDQNAWFDFTPVREYAQQYGYVIAAPYGRGDFFYRGAAEQDVLDVIEDVKKKVSIDPDRIYLMGHSMGGWGCWWIGLRHPDLFATICPMSGFALTELLFNATHLDPFIIHDTDDPIVAVEQSRWPAQKLSEYGISFRYREETGYGHKSKMIGDNFPRVFDWMNAHRRDPKPKNIYFVTRTPARGRAYWLQILETEKFPYPAIANAQIGKPNRVLIKTDNVISIAVNLAELPLNAEGDIEISMDQIENFTIKEKDGWAIFAKDKDKGKWSYRHNPAGVLPPRQSPLVMKVPKDAPEFTSPTLLTSWASQKLCEEIGADLCLFLDDSFQYSGGNLTADAIIDLFVYPEDRLAQFIYKGEELPRHLNLPARLFPLNSINLKARKSSRVLIAPVNLAAKMNVRYELLPDTVGIYLLRALNKAP